MNHRTVIKENKMTNYYLTKFLKDALPVEKVNPYLLYYYFLSATNSTNKSKQLQSLENITIKGLKEFRERQGKIIDQLASFNHKLIESTLKKSAVPGLGISSAFETGICLHFIYGFPYFPASSLKGIASDYAIFFEDKKEDSPEYIDVFGNQKQEGKVIFFDGLPENDSGLFDVEIMTPHYKNYYGGEAWPADYFSPIPIPFLVIKKGVKFVIPIASKDKEAFKNAKRWLEGALKKIGAGAKTSVGYGIFKVE
jgi:CRISPR-associated protein Cmr6